MQMTIAIPNAMVHEKNVLFSLERPRAGNREKLVARAERFIGHGLRTVSLTGWETRPTEQLLLQVPLPLSPLFRIALTPYPCDTHKFATAVILCPSPTNVPTDGAKSTQIRPVRRKSGAGLLGYVFDVQHSLATRIEHLRDSLLSAPKTPSTRRSLSDNCIYNFSMHIGQAEISPLKSVRESCVIEPQ